MNLGTHNSMSYLRPQWWARPFGWAARCQEVDLQRQWDLGARLFDLRVRFDRLNQPYFCHGRARYKADVEETLAWLNENCKGAKVRLMLENKKPDMNQVYRFSIFCYNVRKHCADLEFFGGTDKAGGEIYNFAYKPEVTHLYASATGPCGLAYKWLGFYGKVSKLHKALGQLLWVADDIYPRWYAKRNNAKNLEKYQNAKGWLLVDFVNWQ